MRVPGARGERRVWGRQRRGGAQAQVAHVCGEGRWSRLGAPASPRHPRAFALRRTTSVRCRPVDEFVPHALTPRRAHARCSIEWRTSDGAPQREQQTGSKRQPNARAAHPAELQASLTVLLVPHICLDLNAAAHEHSQLHPCCYSRSSRQWAATVESGVRRTYRVVRPIDKHRTASKLHGIRAYRSAAQQDARMARRGPARAAQAVQQRACGHWSAPHTPLGRHCPAQGERQKQRSRLNIYKGTMRRRLKHKVAHSSEPARKAGPGGHVSGGGGGEFWGRQ